MTALEELYFPDTIDPGEIVEAIEVVYELANLPAVKVSN